MLKKVIIAHGYWGRGGAELATMHLINAIKDYYHVNIITRGGFHLEELNYAAGTSLKAKEINVIYPPFRKLMIQTAGGAIWNALFLRYCRHIAPKYDLCITASRTIGWGVPAFHFLSDVVWNDKLNQQYGDQENKNFIQKLLDKAGRIIAGKARYQLHPNDVFIANSKWTADLSQAYTTSKPKVIYPPVQANYNTSPHKNRVNDFVILGRISPEKRIEEAIEIIKQVRAKGYNIDLTIYGHFDESPYAFMLQKQIKSKPWIKVPGPVYDKEKQKLLPTYKYGINTCRREAFGISTAEMLQAGILTFVPEQGAQSEIIPCNDLIFRNKEDAVEKICKVLADESMQQSLLTQLQTKAPDFSPQRFGREMIRQLNP